MIKQKFSQINRTVRRAAVLTLIVSILQGPAFLHAQPQQDLTPKDVQYLTELAGETWNCLDWLINPQTGLPYDSSDKDMKNTSVTNIGLYAASLAGAVEMGFIKKESALAKADRLLSSLQKLKSWNGFCQSWNDMETLLPSSNDTWISVLDSGNLAAGLIVLKQAFPKLQSQIDPYLNAMDWAKFYVPEDRTLLGGYNMATHAFNKNWKLTALGSDSRLASVIAIGSGKVPAIHWDSLSRKTDKWYGLEYYQPGWQGGGLFMQFLSGLFLDETGTTVGLSAAKFAYAQMVHARVIQSPVWGWSASDSPKDGYLGWGALKDYIVTPHASALPLRYFPLECMTNLQRLEDRGARAPMIVDGLSKKFGFRDAVDVTTNQVTRGYLFLDQSMLFLSLVNTLKDDAIIRLVAKDPLVKKARQQIPDYQTDRRRRNAFWKDVDSLKPLGLYHAVNTLTATRHFPPQTEFSVPVHFVGTAPAGEALQFRGRVMADETGQFVQSVKIDLPTPVMTPLYVKLKLNAGYYLFQTAVVGRNNTLLDADNLTIRVAPENSPDRRDPLPLLLSPSWEDAFSVWTPKRFDLDSGWKINKSEKSKASIQKRKSSLLKLNFDLRSGQWAEMERASPGDLTDLKRLSITQHYKGQPVRLEIKLIDADGSVFGVVLPVRVTDKMTTTAVDLSRLRHYGKGDDKLDMAHISKLLLGLVVPNTGSAGTLEIKSLVGYYPLTTP